MQTKEEILLFLEYAFTEDHNRKYGLNIGYIVYKLFFSDISDRKEAIGHLLDVDGLIDIKKLEKDNITITKSFLLKTILKAFPSDCIVTKKQLREITGLKNRPTFNEYFGNHIKNLGLKGHNFSMLEAYEILKITQDNEIWGRMKLFKKKELVSLFKRNYESLEVELSNVNENLDSYIGPHYVMPIYANRLLDKFTPEQIKDCNIKKGSVRIDCLELFFYFLIIDRLIKKYN